MKLFHLLKIEEEKNYYYMWSKNKKEIFCFKRKAYFQEQSKYSWQSMPMLNIINF